MRAIYCGLFTMFCGVTAKASYLSFDANTVSTITFVQVPILVMDSLGRQTGQQGTFGQQVTNIPNSSYGIESVGDDITGAQGPDVSEAYLRPAGPDQYAVSVFGLAITPYQLTIHASDANAKLSVQDSAGFVVAGGTRQYSVNFDPAPGGQLSVLKIVTFDTLRHDLQAAFQLGQIGDAKFVAKLDKILSKGQEALVKKGEEHEQNKEAIEKLRQFIKKIEKAAKGEREEESEEAQEHEREEEGKRFVQDFALKSLTSDANTLIVQLGGKLKNDRNDHNEDDKGNDR